MRELKFRQWVTWVGGGSRFYYWGFLDSPRTFEWPIGDDSDKVKIVGPHEQYTGLKDKNGVEIYEGDMVHMMFKVEVPTYEGGTHEVAGPEWTGVVTFRTDGACGFFVQEKGGDGCDLVGEADILEVIGDIHENPELV